MLFRSDTRAIINAILVGSIENVPTKTIPYFNLKVPTSLPYVDTGILDPRDTYEDVSQWDVKARHLAESFVINFRKFTDKELGEKLVEAGPHLD